MEQQVNDNAGGDNQAEAKTYTAEQFRGLLADKQTEVRKRQEAERRASDLESQLATLTAGRTQGQASGQEQPPAAAVSDEDRPLTMSDLVRILGEQGQADEASQAVRKGGRVAGGVAGTGMPWFNTRRDVPVSEMTDKELEALSKELL